MNIWWDFTGKTCYLFKFEPATRNQTFLRRIIKLYLKTAW